MPSDPYDREHRKPQSALLLRIPDSCLIGVGTTNGHQHRVRRIAAVGAKPRVSELRRLANFPFCPPFFPLPREKRLPLRRRIVGALRQKLCQGHLLPTRSGYKCGAFDGFAS